MKDKKVLLNKRKKSTSKWYDNILNSRIRQLLNSKNISTEELAKKLDVTVQAIRLWTSGYSRPDIDKVLMLSQIFNVSTDYLLGNSDSKVNDIEYKFISKNLGISDNSIKQLHLLTKNGNKETLNVINCLLENKWFLLLFVPKLYYYYSIKSDYLTKKDIIEADKLDIAEYTLNKMFNKFINDSLPILYNPPRLQKLF